MYACMHTVQYIHTYIHEQPALTFPNRKCDVLTCQNDSPLWKVFQGCGHSFHVECILPDISVCRICQSTLFVHLETLGKAANDAVLTNNVTNIEEDEDEGPNEEENEMDDEDQHQDDENEYESEDAGESININSLLQRISLWRRDNDHINS